MAAAAQRRQSGAAAAAAAAATPGAAATLQHSHAHAPNPFDAPLEALTAGFQQQLQFEGAFDEAEEEEAVQQQPEKLPEWACA